MHKQISIIIVALAQARNAMTSSPPVSPKVDEHRRRSRERLSTSAPSS
jgi:hypothetical protein